MTRQILNVKVWVAALAVGTVATAAAAQQPPAQPAAPPVQQPAGAPPAPATPGQPQAIDRYIVGQAKPPVDPGTSMREMSLEQAIQIALDNNLDLKVARLNPQIQDYSLLAARATFRPVLSGTFNQNHASTLSTNILDAVSTNRITQNQTYSTQLSQNLNFWGANYSISYNTGRATDNSANVTRPVSYSGATRLLYTQPVLAGFRIDNPRNNIRTQQVQRQIVDIQLLQTIENTKGSVRTAYWALRRAIEQVEIQRRALELSQRLLQDNRTKVEIGTMAPIDIVTNESQVANNQQALLNARISWQTAELAFKRLIVTGAEDPLYGQTINPTEQPPALDQVQVDIPKAIQVALQERTDIAQTKKTLESTAFTLELRRNQTLPTLNLNASYTLNGTGGNVYSKGILTQQSGYFDVLSGIAQLDQPTWTVGLTFTYPLGMVQQKANLAQAEIQYQQAQANLKAQELSVSTDVTSAGLAVQNTYQQLQAAHVSTEAAQRNAEAEQTRFDNGMSNNYNIAIAQNNLTAARVSELNAIIAYVNAIADYERKQRIGGGGSTSSTTIGQ
jgi:outer membrane protein TolC